MGITSKIRESYLERLSSKAAERQQRRPGTRAERAAGDSSGIADGKGDLVFAAVLALVCVAALYPALYYGVSAFFGKQSRTKKTSSKVSKSKYMVMIRLRVIGREEGSS
jgi:hypothetical protein